MAAGEAVAPPAAAAGRGRRHRSFVDVLREAGKHARSAVGVAELSVGTPVEVEAIVEVGPEA